jgi:hypothetical protein
MALAASLEDRLDKRLLDFLNQPVRCFCAIIQRPPRLVLGAGGGTVGARSIAISICRARRCREARSIKNV